MSRIGRMPIPVPKGVDVTLDGPTVVVKGPKGTLSHTLVTPTTMLLISVRVRPCRARLCRSSSGRFTSSAPSSARSTVIGEATAWLRVPFGPFTVTTLSSTVTSTPAGTGTGSLPMRDIVFSSCSCVTRRRRGLPHLRPSSWPDGR